MMVVGDVVCCYCMSVCSAALMLGVYTYFLSIFFFFFLWVSLLYFPPLIIIIINVVEENQCL